MKCLSLMLVFLVGGCSSESAPDQNSEAPSGSDLDLATDSSKQKAKKKRKARKKRKPKWTVKYSGDLVGEVSGKIMSVISASTTTTMQGMAMSANRKGKARERFGATLLQRENEAGEAKTQVSMRLADGTECVDVRGGAESFSKTVVHNRGKRSFRATITGDLHCGLNGARDKTIQFTAEVNEKP